MPRYPRYFEPVFKNCYFCQEGIKKVDWKDTKILSKFLSSYGKIESRHRTGLCSKHQRAMAKAVRRARQLALLPYVVK